MNEIEKTLNEHIKKLKHAGVISTKNISDTYHTIGDLYTHRMAFTIALTNAIKLLNMKNIYCYKSLKHHDKTMFEGMFIVVFETPNGQISYHYNLEHWEKFNISIKEKANEYDGHTPEDTVERLIKLFMEAKQ